jgi:hypothetical protein
VGALEGPVYGEAAVGFFDWLFGKKETAAAPPAPRPADPPVPSAQAPAHPPAPNRAAAPAGAPEEENLRRWRESGEARAWVEGRQGKWNHPDWLALLESLRRSRYWPMRPDAVGLVLEEIKRDRANRQK